ncbi:hypothetical protein HDU96_010823 [Phlyctochytrium bullatum]|nr:hypothetical protein HDU96_010823 [Phlyctochytrium bullatum]
MLAWLYTKRTVTAATPSPVEPSAAAAPDATGAVIVRPGSPEADKWILLSGADDETGVPTSPGGTTPLDLSSSPAPASPTQAPATLANIITAEAFLTGATGGVSQDASPDVDAALADSRPQVRFAATGEESGETSTPTTIADVAFPVTREQPNTRSPSRRSIGEPLPFKNPFSAPSKQYVSRKTRRRILRQLAAEAEMDMSLAKEDARIEKHREDAEAEMDLVLAADRAKIQRYMNSDDTGAASDNDGDVVMEDVVHEPVSTSSTSPSFINKTDGGRDGGISSDSESSGPVSLRRRRVPKVAAVDLSSSVTDSKDSAKTSQISKLLLLQHAAAKGQAGATASASSPPLTSALTPLSTGTVLTNYLPSPSTSPTNPSTMLVPAGKTSTDPPASTLHPILEKMKRNEASALRLRKSQSRGSGMLAVGAVAGIGGQDWNKRNTGAIRNTMKSARGMGGVQGPRSG